MTQDRAAYEIGYTEYRTNLPGGQLATFMSMRASIVRADSSDPGPDTDAAPGHGAMLVHWRPVA